jgi:hypothetical protein
MAMRKARRGIELWYGRRQQVGFRGVPQRWYNVLGRVFDAVELEELTVRVDDGPESPLSVGPDRRRLVAPGDFNAEIDLDSVDPGTTTVALTARYRNGGVVSEELVLEIGPRRIPSLPLSVSWERQGLPNEDAQIVDGRWEQNGRFVTTREVGYDRLIAIGDVRWRDVDVTVPVVIHGLETRAYSWPSVHTGVGLVLRWKAQADGRTRYRLKVWREDEQEPASWDLSTTGPLNSLETGSILLAAHETAASFGPVTVRPVAGDTRS